MKHNLFFGVFTSLLFSTCISFAQFSPSVGQPGTTAMFKDSSAFISWASSAKITRGFQDISTPETGYANVGDSASALGIAGTTGVVSLGDGGNAVVQFILPIIDQSGPDFAVFENSFNDTFLELAFVEVSSDGIHFFRFPAISNTDTTIQTGSFGSTDATLIHNLAGKYSGNYGTPFDLADIPNHALLNKQAITHVKVIDVIGCIQNQYCSRDVNQNKVNDPWPTAFGSSGFDLDAIGVIHQQSVGIRELDFVAISVYPNPATDVLHISYVGDYSVTITNSVGQVVLNTHNHLNTCCLIISELNQGFYTLTITSKGMHKQIKFIKD